MNRLNRKKDTKVNTWRAKQGIRISLRKCQKEQTTNTYTEDIM